MKNRVIVWLAVVVLVAPAAPLQAQSGVDGELQRLLDELRGITRDAKRKNAADRWLLRALDDLVDRYDWPWKQQILNEEFSDGDFSRSPAWRKLSGEFWIDGTLGLRSHIRGRQAPPPREMNEPEQQQSPEDVGAALFGAILGEMTRQKKRAKKPQAAPAPDLADELAEIELPLRIANGFALAVEFSSHNPPSQSGELAFTIYQGRRHDWGYRVVLQTGAPSTIDLQRLRRGSAGLIDSVRLDADLNDGRRHLLQLQRRSNGAIALLLDEQALIGAHDASFRDPFDGLLISNRGGDFAVASVVIQGE